MKLILVVFTVLMLVSCTNPPGAKQFLESQGYTEIQTGGYDFLMANKGDISVTSFKAKNSNGTEVKGAVSENMGFFWMGNRWSIKISF